MPLLINLTYQITEFSVARMGGFHWERKSGLATWLIYAF